MSWRWSDFVLHSSSFRINFKKFLFIGDASYFFSFYLLTWLLAACHLVNVFLELMRKYIYFCYDYYWIHIRLLRMFAYILCFQLYITKGKIYILWFLTTCIFKLSLNEEKISAHWSRTYPTIFTTIEIMRILILTWTWTDTRFRRIYWKGRFVLLVVKFFFLIYFFFSHRLCRHVCFAAININVIIITLKLIRLKWNNFLI